MSQLGLKEARYYRECPVSALIYQKEVSLRVTAMFKFLAQYTGREDYL